jgi:hypothetical protein
MARLSHTWEGMRLLPAVIDDGADNGKSRFPA